MNLDTEQKMITIFGIFFINDVHTAFVIHETEKLARLRKCIS